MAAGCVIVGAGQAGFEAASSLRAAGYRDPVTIVGDEPHLPYQRPPLSKGYVLDKQGMDEIELRPAAYYRDHAIEVLTGESVVAIDRSARTLQLASGAVRPYDTLVLAVGARNRRLPVDGAALDCVRYLRTLSESQDIKARLVTASRVVVVGGGFIGLEIAAVARNLGKAVTVIEAQPRLMPRVVAPVISEFYRALHEGHGVEVVCGAAVAGIKSTDEGAAVVCSDGARHPADLVVVGIGVVPNVELAQAAGLAVANGIVVDENLRTTDTCIYAVGDCAEHPNPYAAGRVRLESVQNACDQARTVAASIAGKPTVYTSLPWFWTDQYDVRLQMAGLSTGHDAAVVRGSIDAAKFSVFYFNNGRLIAVDSVNRPGDHMLARRLLASRKPITPHQAADETIDLRKLP
jgi:3-phenylpropionate/trans-cinnamate dioxygenase ferredoxin reductase component